jgi:predicted chitinase
MQSILNALEKSETEKNARAPADVAEKLKFLVTEHPTEWSKKELEKRFGRVKQTDFGSGKLTAEQFSRLIQHIERLCFWEDVKGLPASGLVWHAHPIKFIEHAAKCMWLSKHELAEIYPDKSGAGGEISHGTPADVREKYRVEINKCTFKFGIDTRLRQAHFFGQGAVESKSLKSMLEDASGDAYEKNLGIGNTQEGDGRKFKGRGFKQLTGRYNYAKYWVFKGWLREGHDFDVGWEKSPAKRFPRVDNPDKILEDHFCIDAGCWYIAKLRRRAVAAMDRDDVEGVTSAINGGINGLDDRRAFTGRIKKVVL